MANKTRQERIINRREPTAAQGSSGVTVTAAQGVVTTPVQSAPSTPVGVAVTDTGLSGTGVSASAWASLAWINPGGLVPTSHYVIWDDDPLFGSARFEIVGASQATTVYGLPTNATVYFRVSAGRNNQYSASSAPVSTTTPAMPAPSPISAFTSAWNGRDHNLSMEWTNPNDPNVRDVMLQIHTASGGTLLRTITTPGAEASWLRADMVKDRGAVVLPAFATCYVEVRTRGWDGQLSSAVTATITKALPNIPLSFLHDWVGDSLILDWIVNPDAAGYSLTVDGFEYILGRNGIFEYTYELNQSDHGGVADPTVTVQLREMDAAGQKSALAATINATKPTPSALASPPLAFLSDQGVIRIELPGDAQSKDIWRCPIRVYVGGLHEATIYMPNNGGGQVFYVPEVDSYGYGNYSFDAARQDKYGLTSTYSSTTTPIAIVNKNQVYAMYNSNAGQSIANAGTFAVINFEDVISDPRTLVTTGAAWKFTAPISGMYLVNATVAFTATNTWALAERGATQVYRNGAAAATLARKDNFSGATNQSMQLGGAAVVWCDPGDTLDVRISQTSGAALALTTSATDNFVNIIRLP